MTASLFPRSIDSGAKAAEAVLIRSVLSGSVFPAAGLSLFTGSAADTSHTQTRQRGASGVETAAVPGVGLPLLVASLLLLLALLLAPEQPQHQEAICQRHNGVAACRVW